VGIVQILCLPQRKDLGNEKATWQDLIIVIGEQHQVAIAFFKIVALHTHVVAAEANTFQTRGPV
jgi:hypothetical protein